MNHSVIVCKSGIYTSHALWRHGDLIFSALDSGASGRGSSYGRGAVLYSWARHVTLTVPLSTQVYKWVPAKLMLGGNPAMN